jgi:hypothetical protein
MTTAYNKSNSKASVSDLIRKCFSAYEFKAAAIALQECRLLDFNIYSRSVGSAESQPN